MTNEQIYNTLEGIIDRVLDEIKFCEFDKRRNINSWGFFEITNSQLMKDYSTNSFKFSIAIGANINLIEKYWIDQSSLINLSYPNYDILTYSFNAREFFPEIDNNWYIKDRWITLPLSEQGYLQFKEVATDIISNYLIPKAEQLRDLKVLDRMINYKTSIDPIEERGIFNDNGLVYRRMAIAKLTGNPLYEAICEDERQYFDLYNETSKEQGYEYFANIPKVIETVYNRLKDVQPLKNTVLGK